MKEAKVLVGYILSIVAIVFSFISPFAGLVLGIIGFVQTNKQKGPYAKKGKILSIVAICISVVFIIIAVLMAAGIISLPTIPTY